MKVMIDSEIIIKQCKLHFFQFASAKPPDFRGFETKSAFSFVFLSVRRLHFKKLGDSFQPNALIFGGNLVTY